jgi:hypothetical protein
MAMTTPRAVAAFRARFAEVAEAERAERAAASPQERLREALELHALALQMDLDRAIEDLGADRLAEAIAETNRRRLAASPMPEPLAVRWRALRSR